MDLSVNDVCTSPQTFITLYDQPPLQTGDLLYKNTDGSSIWSFSELQGYFVGTPTFIYVERNGAVAVIKEQNITGYAVVDSTTSCPTPSPTATITPSNTPSVSITPTTTPSISITRTPSTTPPVSGTPSPTPSLSVSNTPSISISATPTPSPSTSDALNSLFLDMANNSYDACHNPESFVVAYDQPPLQNGDYLYKSSVGTAKYTYAELQANLAGSPYPLYLSDGSSVYEVNQDGFGDAVIASVAACVPVTPPASVTPTPSSTPPVSPSNTPPASVTPSVTPSKSFITPSTSSTPPASVTPSISVSTTPSNSPAYCPSQTLGDSSLTSQDACDDFTLGGTVRYLDAVFPSATIIYRFADCTGTAPAGYYSDGTDWRYWDGSSFTTGGECSTY